MQRDCQAHGITDHILRILVWEIRCMKHRLSSTVSYLDDAFALVRINTIAKSALISCCIYKSVTTELANNMMVGSNHNLLWKIVLKGSMALEGKPIRPL